MTKYIVSGLIAALMTTGMISSAAFASTKDRFAVLDANQDHVLTYDELTAHGCKVKHGIFNYADENHDGNLTHHEYNFNYSLFPRCK
jgi:Ca2+-binding EF-hand superfamily protein